MRSVSQLVTSRWVSGKGWGWVLGRPSSVPVSAEGILTICGAVPLRRP